MQRRTLWIIVGSIVSVLLLVCLLAGGAVLYVRQQVQRQGEDVAAILATIESGLESATVTTSATPRASAAARPSGATPTTVPTVTPAPATSPTAEPTTVEPTAAASDAPPAGSTAPANVPAADVVTDLVGDSRNALAAQSKATLYQIDATLDPDQHIVTGTQTVRLTNTENTPLNELYFRLYVNAPHYNEGGITVDAVQINGAAAQTTLEVDDTALKIALPQPLAPGAQAEVAMGFTTTVPRSGGGYGIFNESNGIFTLYNWHPELAVYEEGGWLLNPVTEQGDPTNTDAANYEVVFAAPQDFTVITSGVDGADPAGDADAPRVAALTRNFVVVASDRFERATEQAGDTLVSSYYLPNSEAGGQKVLDTTVKSLEIFGEAFGPYPFAEMDVAQVNLGGGAAGMESTGLIMIGQDLYGAEGGNPLGDLANSIPGAEGADALVFTTAHEVAHQWWYGVVGSDAYQQPWLDESLTNWSSAYYVDEAVDAEAGQIARDLFLAFGYRSMLGEGDQRLDQPVDKFDEQAYSGIVYGKGALMYDVLRAELGDAKFFEFLQRYYRQQQFDRADSAEWLQMLNAVAGKDMTPFYQKWVEGTAITAQDLPPGGPLINLLGR